LVRTHFAHFQCWDKPRANLDSFDSPQPGLGASHHLPPYSILCSSPLHLHPNGFFSQDSQSHYNNRGLFCDPHIIANNKERSFWKPAFANHNSSQNLKLLQNQNIRTRTITSPSQLPNLTQSQNFSDYNCFYILFAINITSKTICNKPITATT